MPTGRIHAAAAIIGRITFIECQKQHSISGMIEDDKIQDLKLSGADEFLHKPFEIEALIDRMCGLLEIEAMDATTA